MPHNGLEQVGPCPDTWENKGSPPQAPPLQKALPSRKRNPSGVQRSTPSIRLRREKKETPGRPVGRRALMQLRK